MELHYAVVTVLFIVLVLVLCFVAVSMFLPVYWSGRSSPLFNSTVSPVSETRSTGSSETFHTSVASTTTSTTTLLTSPPPGGLRVKSYDIRVEDNIIRVGLVLENTYPVEVIVEKIYLNDTLVFRGSRVIDPQSFINSIANDPAMAEAMTTIWISTDLNPAPNSEIIACGKTITVGNLTIIYRIPDVKGTYNITLSLKLPECMIK